MGKTTTIAWTHGTMNGGWGCRMVDKACGIGEDLSKRGCYMFRMSRQWGIDPEVVRTFEIRSLESKLRSYPPETVLIFFNDMTDTFGEFFEFETIAAWFEFFARHPEREFQVLTKRIGRALVFFRDYWKKPIPRNVWIGCSIGEKNRLFRIGQLLAIKALGAKIVFISAEPLIEDLGEFSLEGVDWVIVGGESGSDPRRMDAEWAENIRRIANRDGAAFFFKQVGGRGGNNAGGDKLNGKQYKEFPDWGRP